MLDCSNGQSAVAAAIFWPQQHRLVRSCFRPAFSATMYEERNRSFSNCTWSQDIVKALWRASVALWPMVAKPIKLCEIALYSLNYFWTMTNKKKGANQLSFTANCLLGKTTVTGIRELEQRGFWKTQVLTGNGAFSPLICLVDANKFVLLNFFTLLQRQFARKLGKTTAQECKESTSAWRPSLKDVFAKAGLFYLFFSV